MNPFAGRTALVTGAASGIGKALAADLRTRDVTVVTTDVEGDVDHRLDVRDEHAWRALIDEIGVPDLLFSNAGISMGGPTHELSAAHWERIIDVNLGGAVNAVHVVYSAMDERGSGTIVFTASGAGLAAPPFVTPYAATKHAVVGLALGLRPEAALHGVRVSVLCPGSVETPILDRLPDPDLPMGESQPVTARRYLAVVKQKPVAADRFARLALDQLAKNRAIVVVPRAAKSLWLLHRLSPAVVDRISGVIARRVDRQLVAPR
jgi:NAD(P)-dependent dehydrogenase (short-subunit alcohol dehydrogenase family)